MDTSNTNHGFASRSRIYCSASCALAPAGPPVTGDGDESDCEACEDDASFRCVLCGDDSCGEHAQEHDCPEVPHANAAVVKLVAEWEALKLLPHGLKGTLVATLHDSYAAGLARGRALGARDERQTQNTIIEMLKRELKVIAGERDEARHAGRTP